MTSRFKTLAIGLVVGFLMGAVTVTAAETKAGFVEVPTILQRTQNDQLFYVAGASDMLGSVYAVLTYSPEDGLRVVKRQAACLQRRGNATVLGGLWLWAVSVWKSAPVTDSGAWTLFTQACTGLN
jgi:hypothetical protein